MPPPTDDPYWKQIWDLQVDTLQRLVHQVAEQERDIAVIKVKVGFFAGLFGLAGGVAVDLVKHFFLK